MEGMTEVRAELASRLADRREEIAGATWACVQAVDDPAAVADRHYLESLRRAVPVAVDYAIAAIGEGEARAAEVPLPLRTQARLAANVGVSLDTVLRRYFSGFILFNDFVLQEVEPSAALQHNTLHHLLRAYGARFDRLIEAVGEEFTRECEKGAESPERRRAARVKRLLAGDLLGGSDLAYDFDAHHVGLVAVGSEAAETLRSVAARTGYASLIVAAAPEVTWAWFGSRRHLDPHELGELLAQRRPHGVSLTLGEAGQGLSGWRLTHRQAQAAVPVVLRETRGMVRYCEVVLLASMLHDDLLAASLRQLYLAPISAGRDGGAALRKTLRAYFAANGNISSAAASLGVNRHTVASRLQAVEERIGRSLAECAAEMQAALQLEDFGLDTVAGGADRIGWARPGDPLGG